MSCQIQKIQSILDIVIPSGIAFLAASWRGKTITTINPIHAALSAGVATFLHKGIYLLAGRIHDWAVTDSKLKYEPSMTHFRMVAYTLLTASTLSLGYLAKQTTLSFEIFTGWLCSALYVSWNITIFLCENHREASFHMGPYPDEAKCPPAGIWF